MEKKTKTLQEIMKDLGIQYNSKAQNIIRECDDWYSNEATEFHKRTNVNGIEYTINSMNFGKRCCADDANLCEIVEINAGEDTTQFDGINEILEKNRFSIMYRKQLEELAASGTVGCYLRLDEATYLEDNRIVSGDIRLNYVNGECIAPITVVNDEIIDCAFVGQDRDDGFDRYTIVIFQRGDDGRYGCDTYIYKDGIEATDERSSIQLGTVKPFAIMTSAEANNIKNMKGYGYPKIYGAIPVLKMLDLAFNILFSDLDKGEKMMFINELLACIQTDKQGRPYLTKKQQEQFILLGEKLPTQDSLIYEYNPELRIQAITQIFETCLSFLSMSFGYGTKKYTFENGQIKTASEYIGERQDCMQELNKQRQSAIQYITEICDAIIWFSNTFNSTSWQVPKEVNVEFDDSYIEDKTSKLESMRNDALQFPEVPQLKVWYFMEKYNLSEEEAWALIGQEPTDDDDTLGEE
jgi:A118 family predicted phage portal protein